jgi:hypothetical protein
MLLTGMKFLSVITQRSNEALKRQHLGPVDNLIGISKTCVEFISIQVFYWRNSYDGPQ